jgi:hypothetical protein
MREKKAYQELGDAEIMGCRNERTGKVLAGTDR